MRVFFVAFVWCRPRTDYSTLPLHMVTVRKHPAWLASHGVRGGHSFRGNRAQDLWELMETVFVRKVIL